MKKLGTVPIPSNRYQKHGMNRAKQARQILSELTPGKADLYEFESKKEAQEYRSMLSSMAILKYGEAGHIGTSIMDNTLFIWEKSFESQENEEEDKKPIPVDFNVTSHK